MRVAKIERERWREGEGEERERKNNSVSEKRVQDKTLHSLYSVGNAWTLLRPENKKGLFFGPGLHGLNALLCHPGPKKTRAPSLTAGWPHTVVPINGSPFSPACVCESVCPLLGPRAAAKKANAKTKQFAQH